MKISKLYIHDFQQFKEFELDFTYPKGHEKAGQPLEKVCFIGANGTGKTTILNFLNYISFRDLRHNEMINGFIKVSFDDKHKVFLNYNNKILDFTSILDSNKLDENYVKQSFYKEKIDSVKQSLEYNKELEFILLSLNDNYLICNILAEDLKNASHFEDLQNIPKVTLNEVLEKHINHNYHTISNLTIREFWKNLIYNIKKRESNYLDFQNKPENQSKTLKDVKEIFEQNNPTIIDKIALLWDKILAKAGLELDKENIKNPVQLTDNLHAYIKLKSTGERISYHQLSTGIRNYIFKIGHLYSIYFNKNVESGILLFDEPENSLFPDFLYDIIETYQNVTQNTQLFVATHNPIVASQFESFERFILEFDENGKIKVLNGVAPIGDDANDILYKDFGIRSIYGKEGLKNWERFVELKSLIQSSQNMKEKAKLADEFLKIGTKYNFQINGVS